MVHFGKKQTVLTKTGTIEKQTLTHNSKPMIFKITDAFMFKPNPTKQSTCIVFKDTQFLNQMNKLNKFVSDQFPGYEVKSPHTEKDGSTDEFIMYPYLSDYARWSYNGSSTTRKACEEFQHITGFKADLLVKITTLSIDDEKKTVYFDRVLYSVNLSEADQMVEVIPTEL